MNTQESSEEDIFDGTSIMILLFYKIHMSVRKNVLNIACSLSLSPIKVHEHVIGDKSNMLLPGFYNQIFT